MNCSDRAAVGDDEDAAAWMQTRDPPDAAEHARRHLLVGLAVCPARPSVDPAGVSLWETLTRLVARKTRPRPDVDLTQLGKLQNLEIFRLGDDRSRLAGAP
jgi:hypothetical protein